MGNRLPDGLGWRGHWVDMLGGYKGEVNRNRSSRVGLASKSVWLNLRRSQNKMSCQIQPLPILNGLALKHSDRVSCVKHQERAGHAPTSPTEARENVHGGFSLSRERSEYAGWMRRRRSQKGKPISQAA